MSSTLQLKAGTGFQGQVPGSFLRRLTEEVRNQSGPCLALSMTLSFQGSSGLLGKESSPRLCSLPSLPLLLRNISGPRIQLICEN